MKMMPLNALLSVLLSPVLFSQQHPEKLPPSAKDNHQSETVTVTATFPLEFRSIRLGMTLEQSRKALERYFPPGKELDPRISGLVACGDYTTLSCKDEGRQIQSCRVASYCGDEYSGTTQYLSLQFVDGKLAEMMFAFPHDAIPDAEVKNSTTGLGFDNYTGIHSALTDKYGNCQIKQEDFQTKAGAHFTSLDSYWSRGTTSLKLEELCGNLDQSCLTLSDREL